MIITSLATSTDDRYAAAITVDGSLEVWELANEQQRHTLNLKEEFLNTVWGPKTVKHVLFLADTPYLCVIDGTVILLLSVDSNLHPAAPLSVVRCMSTRCVSICVASLAGTILVGSTGGLVVRMDLDGRILTKWRLPDVGDITQLSPLRSTVLVGTSTGRVFLCDMTTGQIKSKFEHRTRVRVSRIVVDRALNWFAAIIGSNVFVGSTRSLASVFVSPDFELVTHVSFLTVPNAGLSIVVGGARSSLRVFPLDFSECTKQISIDELKSVFAMTPSGHSGLAIAGDGGVALFSSGALQSQTMVLTN
jgi:WD40 repeat protein